MTTHPTNQSPHSSRATRVVRALALGAGLALAAGTLAVAPAEGASFSPPVLVKPPIFQDAPYWVAPITTAPVNKTITATVQWGMPHSGLVCAMVYPGFKSSPAGVTGTVVSRTLTATTVTLTAAKPGTYKVTYGYDSCHMSPALTVRFV